MPAAIDPALSRLQNGNDVMTVSETRDSRFGAIAVEMNFVGQDKVEKALVVQARIFDKTRVNMHIGEILIEMSVLTPSERDEILRMQREIEGAEESTAGKNAKKPRPAASSQKESGTLDISVSKDKLTATAFLDGPVPTTEFEVDDVKIMLHSEGILFGIADDEQIKAYLEGKFKVGEPWIIAAGTEPIPDTPAEIRYHFDTDPLKIGTLTEEGRMDWKDRGQLPQVREGALLAEMIPGPPGKEGMDIFGKKIPVPKAKTQRFKCGRGARRSEDGMQVHASLAGMPKLTIAGEILVMPTLHVQGDISLKTGHVEFDGHIEVDGAVEKGYRVKGGSLRANEIRDAQVEVDGDVTVIDGIFGATIRCGGNLKAGHIHHTKAIVAGDMAVEKEIIESGVEANGRCMINDGTIISSTISARMGIIAMDIGTPASSASDLTVGIDRHLEREADALRDEIQTRKAAQESLPKKLAALRQRSDDINTRLGQVAQEQDGCMVQSRKLQEKIDAGLLAHDDDTTRRLQQTLIELKAKQDAYDLDVAQLMEEDDALGKEIASTEEAIREGATSLRALDERLKTVAETQKNSGGLSVVRAGGNLMAGTKITGPHSCLVVQENIKRLSVTETDAPDRDGSKRWRFELTPYR